MAEGYSLHNLGYINASVMYDTVNHVNRYLSNQGCSWQSTWTNNVEYTQNIKTCLWSLFFPCISYKYVNDISKCVYTYYV